MVCGKHGDQEGLLQCPVCASPEAQAEFERAQIDALMSRPPPDPRLGEATIDYTVPLEIQGGKGPVQASAPLTCAFCRRGIAATQSFVTRPHVMRPDSDQTTHVHAECYLKAPMEAARRRGFMMRDSQIRRRDFAKAWAATTAEEARLSTAEQRGIERGELQQEDEETKLLTSLGYFRPIEAD